jgi:8-oxo-dGTP pyrophosphatase MutT (NUDIX family)
VHEINFTRTNRNDDVITISTKSRDLAQPFQLHRILTEESIPTELALRYNDGKPELIISNKSIDTIGTIRIMPNREQTELSPPGQTTLPLEAKPRLSETTTGPTTHRVIHIALNVIWRKDPTTQQLEYLLIQEAAGSRSAGLWYLPAGRVEENESPEQGAIREALEESGMVINLGEVLATESWRLGNILKMRHIFSATPRFDQEPKSHSDQHSMKAAWFRLDEIESLPLRGTEILDYLRKIHTRESKS